MDRLIEIWREACRSVEVAEFLARTAPALQADLGFESLLVRRFDLEHRRIETIAAAAPGKRAPSLTRTDCSPQEIDALLAWARGSEILFPGAARERLLLALLARGAADGHVIAAPLAADEERGALLLSVAHGGRVEGARLAHLRAVLEPFSAALQNDRRLHELARLREAAEADNRALLSRLQRQDILESVVGAESGLSDVMARVEKVASTDAPVLILGETGSGKEVIARALHGRSPRAAGPMVRVNCGAIPSELVDSELFGHEKGSFTGAINAHRGWFERADGGTLFLDEIGELPFAAQVRLLRILQDGTFERVGGSQSRSVDVRLVAATHRNLEDMVARGAFRQDLWYRISVFPIRLPPLRERRGDVADLASHFARSAGKRLGGVALAISADDLELLLGYDWPGNVRELAAVIERAAILGDGKKLELAAALGGAPRSERQPDPLRNAHSPSRDAYAPGRDAHARGRDAYAPGRDAHAPGRDAYAPGRDAHVSGREAHAAGSSAARSGEKALDAAMKRHIEAALASTLGRIEGPFGAAQLLDVNPHTLRARMRKLGIDWQQYRPARG